MNALRRFFRIDEAGSSVSTELVAGLSTFLTMSYIVFVNPAILSDSAGAGMDFGAVMIATCLASAAACLAMGLLANYPIALAPGMGHNAIFSFVICGAMGFTWQQALAATFVSGCLFLVLCAVPFREKVLELIPESLRQAIGAGIGLLIALVGLEYAGIVIGKAPTYVTLGNLQQPATLVAISGLVVTLVLMARRFRGAILAGVVTAAAVGYATGVFAFTGLEWSLPKASAAGSFVSGFGHLLDNPMDLVSILFVLFFLDLFDTVGTLAGVTSRAGLMKEGKLPRARWAFFSDAFGTVTGAALGTSTVTSYIESGAGIQAGGRTGLANMMTAGLFLLTVAALPVVKLVAVSTPVEYTYGFVDGAPQVFTAFLYPTIAPALIVVGAMMMQNVVRIDWEDPTEYLPAFLALLIMPVAFSITDGIAFGFVAMSLLKIATGRWRDVHWTFHLISLLFVARFVWLTV